MTALPDLRETDAVGRSDLDRPAVALSAVTKVYGHGAGGVPLPGRRLRLRQEHPAEPGGRPGSAHRGHDPDRGRRGPGTDVPGAGPVPLADRGAERRASAAVARPGPPGT